MSLPAPARLSPTLRSVLWHGAVAALMASAWASVVLIKTSLQPGPPLPWGDGLLLFLGAAHADFLAVVTTMFVAAMGLRRLPAQGSRRWLALAGLVALCAVIGAVQYGLRYDATAEHGWRFGWDYLPYLLVRQGALALLLVGLGEAAEQRRRAAEALHAAELRSLAVEGELSEAQLSLLQAQVEPHFLFNSLANVRWLLRTDPPAASALLNALRRYLHEALPRLRETRTTLGREAELVTAFLSVHRVRMGERLQTTVDVPAALADRVLPPMLLLTLVENAIKHGLQPLVDGGAIRVAARATGGRLMLTVADTGRGMGSGMGHGTGLANLQARLKATYGSAAAFSLRLNEPRGVVAEITLPEQTA